ncbi:uncharacterized protein AB675_9825 [Cyphellophora attinorum]|uniref:Uncharacterized protein n=1 Tax=Cyphellophora attinorum TaxID=1664694 RepID=A0A0N1H7P5_9EURO|nr:uncharacterized protein AB675_9825 [Phialophora attinorum]KPI42622.1 hypothetical protein AB675_9825 [Phialophora attinorum]
MVNRVLLITAITSLLSGALAKDTHIPTAVTTEDPRPKPPPPPHKVIAAFFVDSACETPIPIPKDGPSRPSTRTIVPGACVNDFDLTTYSSVNITHIDNFFNGKNAALEIGSSSDETCDFTNSVKFDISNTKLVNECLFIGIPQTSPGRPLLPGDEYQISALLEDLPSLKTRAESCVTTGRHPAV